MEKLKLKKGAKDDDNQKLTKEFTGLSFLLLGVLTFVALFSYSATDPSFGIARAEDYEIQNSIGLAGAYLAGGLVHLLGIGAYICSFFLVAFGAGFMGKWLSKPWFVISGYVIFALSLVCLADAWDLYIKAIHGGGLIGHYLYSQAILYFSPTGSALILIFILLLSSQLIFNLSWINIGKGSCEFMYAKGKEYVDNRNNKDRLTRLSRGWADEDDEEFDQKKLDWRKYLALPAFLKKNKDEDDEEEEGYYDDEDEDYYDYDDEEPLELQLQDVDVDESVGMPKDIYKDDKKGIDIDYEDYEDDDEEQSKKSKWIFFGKKAEPKKKAPPIKLPPVNLLSVGQATDIRPNQKALTEKGERLIAALADYGISASMVRATPGPVITMYEIHPAAGIRVSKIAGLADDLAMKLKAVAVRIQAPIPGTDSIGIEVPNDERANVSFRELIEGNAFHNSSSLLTMALGKNISGSPVAADLAKMPHLLIAGATGAGKSVCINSILISLLYKAKPDEMKLLLIDPKRIELAIYDDLPHLVHPVVTEMELAKNALLWAIEEMNRRFRLLRDLKVRNITSYNEKVLEMPKTILSEELQNSDHSDSTELAYHKHMPYLVIIIDELADLIMSHGKDVESSIVRLAQLARAAGIHIILATQRPSVDVVTGLIKANFPCRISFQVTQKVDSRTILDTAGAETLLGRGDMLFKPGGGKLQRLHGAFVPDEDVIKVVDYWKKKQKPSYKLDFTIYGETKYETNTEFNPDRNDISKEPVYQEAIKVISTMDKVTISGLQRKLRIGFNKAALVKEQLEKDGYIQN